MRLRSHLFKKYPSFFSERLEMWENRRRGWRIKKVLPAMKQIIADIDKYLSYVAGFKQYRLELEKSKMVGGDVKKINAKLSAYNRIIKGYDSKIHINVKQFVNTMKKTFDNLEQIDYSTEGMADKQLNRIKTFEKAVQRKLRALNIKGIAGLKKEARKAKLNENELNNRLAAFNRQFSELCSYVNSRINLLTSDVTLSLKSRWKKAKRQLKGYWQPREEIVHIANDQLIREMKNDAKDVVVFVKEEISSLSKLKKAKTAAEFKTNFDILVQLYEKTKSEIGHVLEYDKVMIHRFKGTIERLEAKIKGVLSETEFREIKEEFESIHRHIESKLAEIEEQSKFLMNEAAKQLGKVKAA